MTKKNTFISSLVFKNIFSQNLIMLSLIKLSMVILVSFFVSCDRSGFTNKNKVKLSDEMQYMLNALLDGDYIVEAEPFFQPEDNDELTGEYIHVDSVSSGINFKNSWNPDKKYKGQLGNSFIAAGVAVGDYNNDGLQDLYLARQQDGGKLFQNIGGFKFKDVTKKVGINSAPFWSTGVSFIDINNDGWLDIYVCAFDSPNKLYINNRGKFNESAGEFGLDFSGASVSMSFADIDLDGDLDAYLLTNRLQDTDSTLNVKTLKNKPDPYVIDPKYEEVGYFIKRPGKVPLLVNAGQFDHLYLNDNGKFINVTKESGIGKNPYYGLSATWWDYNDDGLPDLYVANDYMGPDHLFQNMGKNEHGITQFKDVVSSALPYTPWFSMGSDYSDINNDGLMDLMASDMAGSNHYRDKVSMGSMSGPNSEAWFLNFPNPPQYMRNTLFLNTGTERFMEIAYLAGLAATDWTWTVKFGDLDNDGFEDVYFTNGMSRDFVNGDLKDRFRVITNNDEKALKESDLWENEEPYKLSNMVFKNLGNYKFKDTSIKWNLDYFGVSTGSALGDLDNDGDLDIVMNGFDEEIRIYRNELKSGNSVRVILEGLESNVQGLGCKVIATYDEGKRLTRYLSSSRGFMSSSEPVLHFGIAKEKKIDSLFIYWPTGTKQIISNLPANLTYRIKEKSSSKKRKAKVNPMFVKDRGSLSKIVHQEKIYDDFKRENLLPNKLSQLGSGVSWGDIDGDGDDDIFVGGSKGFPSKLYINKGKQKFENKFQLVFINDSKYEDMGSVFFDPDRDGDLDLFVVSGGVECNPGDPILQDRLYINDGKGNFGNAAEGLIPKLYESGSVVSVADINQDGRDDLFIGGRTVPGNYPSSPRSFILINSGARFINETQKVAPSLANAGMVTSAIFSDVNNDDWPDLLVTYEWGPVRFYLNDKGRLSDKTSMVGLDSKIGWFSSISPGDIDNDGDIDFIVGNTGYNTKYKASYLNPEILYYGDFEGNGKRNIIEAKFEDNVCFPRRGLGCSSDAMPIIKERFPTYHQFAISSVDQIYSQELLDKAQKFEVNELASAIIENRTTKEGKIQFSFQPLPRIVQSSPIFGTALCDVNGDGNLDLYVVQNFSGPQRETGYMRGGVSHLLLGDGMGNFTAISPNESGLVVSADAKSLTINDVDRDGKVDFLVGVNNGKFLSFINDTDFNGNAIRLSDLPKGKHFIGAKIWLHFNNGNIQMHQLSGSSGYLSQSGPVIYIGNKSDIKKMIIKWPNGSKDEINFSNSAELFSSTF